jgi:uncharacterized protein (TIGR04255 family)
LVDWLSRDPEDRQLDGAQLALVVCQIRHEREVAASDAARALRVHEAVGWSKSLNEQLAQELSVIAGGGGISAAPLSTNQGWQLQSDDGQWVASILPDNFSLETKAYGGWSEFRERLLSLVESVVEHIGPTLETRIGLRFVNQFNAPPAVDSAYWDGRISELIHQRVLYEGLGISLRTALQVLEIESLEGYSLVMRHGCQQMRSNVGSAYTLDMDCSRQRARALDAKKIADTVDSLHRLALQAFEMATTPAFRDELGEGSP